MQNPPNKIKSILGNQQVLLLLVLVAMIGFFTWRNSVFFTNSVFANIISDWCPLVLIALGETFVIISGGIDLSVGSTVAVSGVVAAYAMQYLTNHKVSILGSKSANTYLIIGLLVAIGIGLIVGLINSLLINRANVVPFISTLVTMGAGAGLAIVFTGGAPISGVDASTAIAWSVNKVGPFSYPGLVIVLIVIALGLVLHMARFGRYTFAIGSNEFSARAVGINTKKHLTKIYILSSVLASLAGYYYYLRLGVGAPTSGQGGELQAIAAVVIGGAALTGGVGNIIGSILGTFILTTVASGLILINVAANWKQVVVAILIALAVLLQQARQSTSKTGFIANISGKWFSKKDIKAEVK
jgi:ribose transport system permease protein